MFHTFIAWCASSLSNVVALDTSANQNPKEPELIGDPEAELWQPSQAKKTQAFKDMNATTVILTALTPGSLQTVG